MVVRSNTIQILLCIMGSIPLVCLIALSACCVYLISSKGHMELEDYINDTVKVSSVIEVKVADVISKDFLQLLLIHSIYELTPSLIFKWMLFKIRASIFLVYNRLTWLSMGIHFYFV